ncbi:MAG: DNA replication/repair protein RecF [Chloroflexota bacterium]
MHLTRLELEQFRAYERLDLRLQPAGLRLHGANASGKSSLLEAIVMLATTRSPRSGSDRETIRWGSGQEFGVAPFARLLATVERRDGPVEIEIRLQGDTDRAGVARKSIRINGRPSRASDAVGQLKAVLFSPEDVSLASGSPSGRRRHLDLSISQTSGAYLRALSRYGRVLEQRNGLLRALQKERAAPGAPHVAGQLAFWDAELLDHGSVVTACRALAIARLSAFADERFRSVTGGSGLDLAYLPGLGGEPVASDREFEHLRLAVRRRFEAELERRRGEEIRRGVSVVGPHRDDFAFRSGGVDLGVYGSRGQQRLAVISLKLAETALMAELAGEPPVLLLDDVMSELDPVHRRMLEHAAGSVAAQVIVTGTDAADWMGAALRRLPGARLANGAVTPEEDGPVAG